MSAKPLVTTTSLTSPTSAHSLAVNACPLAILSTIDPGASPAIALPKAAISPDEKATPPSAATWAGVAALAFSAGLLLPERFTTSMVVTSSSDTPAVPVNEPVGPGAGTVPMFFVLTEVGAVRLFGE